MIGALAQGLPSSGDGVRGAASMNAMILTLQRTRTATEMQSSLDAGSPVDFDFIMGHWHVRHSRLNARLADCHEWTDFEGTSSTSKILGGAGNVEDNQMFFPEGTFRAAAIRSYCAKSGTWSIWWLDGRHPTALQQPVVGRFENGIGIFYADDVLGDRPIKVRFTWRVPPSGRPHWEQAFSGDAGLTWETNWTMEFTPRASLQDPPA